MTNLTALKLSTNPAENLPLEVNGYRLSLEHWQYEADFEEFIGDSIALVSYGYARFSGEITKNDFLDLRGFLRYGLDYCESQTEKAEAISKHLSRQSRYLSGQEFYFELITFRGYSQGDWHDAAIYSEYPITHKIKRALIEWYRGDIYEVRLERPKVFTAEDGETITRYELEDSRLCLEMDAGEIVAEMWQELAGQK